RIPDVAARRAELEARHVVAPMAVADVTARDRAPSLWIALAWDDVTHAIPPFRRNLTPNAAPEPSPSAGLPGAASARPSPPRRIGCARARVPERRFPDAPSRGRESASSP